MTCSCSLESEVFFCEVHLRPFAKLANPVTSVVRAWSSETLTFVSICEIQIDRVAAKTQRFKALLILNVF